MAAPSTDIDLNGLGNPRFKALLEEEWATHCKKAAGYSGSENPDTWSNFREAENIGLTPLQGCMVRLGDKFKRAQNVYRNAANDQVGETLRETLMDLSNYGHIAVCLLEEEQEAKPARTDGLSLDTVFVDELKRDVRASLYSFPLSGPSAYPEESDRSWLEMSEDVKHLAEVIMSGTGADLTTSLKVATDYVGGIGRRHKFDEQKVESVLASMFQGKIKNRFNYLGWRDLAKTFISKYDAR